MVNEVVRGPAGVHVGVGDQEYELNGSQDDSCRGKRVWRLRVVL